ncbi:MAG: pyruvate synthase subunit beta [Desulfobacterales bacterium]|nr:MAG: pyruvate synthase subunit beta [Desulfobacterales bacterium]
MCAAKVETRESLFVSGHRACHGCGLALAVRHILEATGPNVIVVSPTGCLETFTSPYGYSPWRVPWIHHVFENAPAVASGVVAALKAQGRPVTRVVAIGGDGATFDIGFGALSGMLERGDDVLYICTDNGAYMNTGGQRSGATPSWASTTTHPAGKQSVGKTERKKDLPEIVAAHGIPYVATASVAYLRDLKKKVKKAMTFHGPRYIQIDTPCPSGWNFPSHLTLEVGRQAVKCGLVPLFEMENGKIIGVRKLKKKLPVTEYLQGQKRYRHLFESDGGQSELQKLQAEADKNIEKYGLMESG